MSSELNNKEKFIIDTSSSFSKDLSQQLGKDVRNKADAHTRMDVDPHAPIGHFPNLLNHTEGPDPGIGKPSQQYYLRNAFIQLLYEKREDGVHTISDILRRLEKKGFSASNLHCYLHRLSENSLKELAQMLEHNAIPLEVDKTTYILNGLGNRDVAPENDTTKQMWEIEKRYLNYWLEKARAGAVEQPSCGDKTFFIPWETDGMRIASCCRKNWYLSCVFPPPPSH